MAASCCMRVVDVFSCRMKAWDAEPDWAARSLALWLWIQHTQGGILCVPGSVLFSSLSSFFGLVLASAAAACFASPFPLPIFDMGSTELSCGPTAEETTLSGRAPSLAPAVDITFSKAPAPLKDSKAGLRFRKLRPAVWPASAQQCACYTLWIVACRGRATPSSVA
ncbi:hypothetical protein GQ54DRAFT_74827 [Martensiomyces pterosporus]|nr:hypothetical protein GQ54DRAFT_74827 [Martensiomyces pterosporus]